MKQSLCLLFGLLSCAAALPAVTLDAGAHFEVRLRQSVASYSSVPGAEVQADLIAPVHVGNQIVLPQGSVLRGSLKEVYRVGWGLRRQRASIRFDFTGLQLPDGTSFDVKTRLVSLENAREKVDPTGKIVGIRATAPFGHRLAGIARNLFIWDPMLELVVAGSTSLMLDFPESEISLPAGSEFSLVLEQPVEFDTTWSTPLPRITVDPVQRAALQDLVRNTTTRTVSAKTGKQTDVVNLILIGEPESIQRAFVAAGWVRPDELSKKSGWMTFRSVAESRSYPTAPMSAMLLDETPAALKYSKSLNTFSKRHHVRIYDQPSEWNGRAIMAASSTQDVAISYSFKSGKLVHLIDRNIDNERAKIVNDLVYTGCVDAGELIERPWIPTEARNTVGEVIHTDGAIAVLELNPCRTPLRIVDPAPPLQTTGGRTQHMGRQFFLIVGTDFTYNNPVYQAGLGLKWLWKQISGSEDPTQPQRRNALHPPPAESGLDPVPDSNRP